MMQYMETYEYSFKYDDEIKDTKRQQAKVRADARKEKSIPDQQNRTSPGHKKVGLRVNCCYWTDVLDEVFDNRCVADLMKN